MKKILLAFALVSLLLLSGCTRAVAGGTISDQREDCKNVDKLKLKIERARCLHNVATLHFSDPLAVDICADIRHDVINTDLTQLFEWMDDAVTKNIRNDCYYEVAVRRAEIGDVSAVQICDKIKGTILEPTDPSPGEGGNMLLRDQCFYMVAVALQNEAICDYIDVNSLKEDVKRDPTWAPILDAYGNPIPEEDRKFRDICKQEIPP